MFGNSKREKQIQAQKVRQNVERARTAKAMKAAEIKDKAAKQKKK